MHLLRLEAENIPGCITFPLLCVPFTSRTRKRLGDYYIIDGYRVCWGTISAWLAAPSITAFPRNRGSLAYMVCSEQVHTALSGAFPPAVKKPIWLTVHFLPLRSKPRGLVMKTIGRQCMDTRY